MGWTSHTTVTIDLSDASAQIKMCCDSTALRFFAKGLPLVDVTGTPGFKPVTEVGYTDANNVVDKTVDRHQKNDSSEGWDFYYKSEEARKIAVTALQHAITLCKSGS
jgi:hypothetical protein